MHAPDRKTAGKKSSEDKRTGPKFSVETLDRDLKLSARGAADGKKDFPESSAEDLCAFERGIVDRVDAELQKRADGVIGAGSSTDFSGLQRDLETLSGEPKTALAQFRAKKARAQQALGIILTRLGPQMELGTTARSNRMPFFASLSMFGVSRSFRPSP